MRTLLMAVLMSSSVAYAKVCKDSDQGLIPEAAGKVIYSLGEENCLGDSCYGQVVKEFDRCLDSQKLLEFACQQGEIIEKEILCAPDQVCRQGACVKK
ncbi:hypothetical protein ACES2I_12155 [Bdellovibrio bacteriovorus]|uniref:hypothetical protein n=1 Tax=Bdellovibrio bacteriovorus TaxID=959 RepID=UPI0035A68756